MALLENVESAVELDDEGFIVNPDEWDEEVALALASADGIAALGADHWKIIRFLREYYEKYGTAPMIRKLCKETGTPLQSVYELFPKGPVLGACRIAGLPKPVGCV